MDTSFRVIDGRYLLLRLSSSLTKFGVIVGDIAGFEEGRVAGRVVRILGGFLTGIAEAGGMLGVVLRRDLGTIRCFLVASKCAILSRSLRAWVNRVLAGLRALSQISGTVFRTLSRDDITKILGLLLRQGLLVRYYGTIEVSSLGREGIPSRGRGAPQESEVIASAEPSVWSLMGEDSYIVCALSLDDIRRIIRLHMRYKNERNNAKGSGQRIHRLRMGLGILYDGVPETPSEILDSIFSTCSMVAPIHISGRYGREGPLSVSLFSSILAQHNRLRIRGDASSILGFLSTTLYVLLMSRRSTGISPRLDIYDDFAHGEIHIGWQLLRGEPVAPFYISVEDVARHVLILGRTGMGKSRLARIILERLLEMGICNVWIFDFHGEHRDLCNMHDFELYVPGTLSRPLFLNIFDSGDDDPETYSSFLLSLLSETTRLKDDEMSAQMERASSYAITMTVMDEDPSPRTFLRYLAEWCRETGRDMPSAIYTFYAIINRFKSLFSGISKNCFWVTRSNIDIGRMLQRNVLFDLSYMFRENLKRETFILTNILLRYTISRLFKETRPKERGLRLCVLVEEGRYIMPWRRVESTMSTTALEDFAALARKYGLGLIVISQSPHTISPDIIANAGTLFLMNTEIPETEQIFEKYGDAREYISVMPPREAIARLTSRPALIHVKIKEHRLGEAKEETYGWGTGGAGYIIEETFEEYVRRIVRDMSE